MDITIIIGKGNFDPFAVFCMLLAAFFGLTISMIIIFWDIFRQWRRRKNND